MFRPPPAFLGVGGLSVAWSDSVSLTAGWRNSIGVEVRVSTPCSVGKVVVIVCLNAGATETGFSRLESGRVLH